MVERPSQRACSGREAILMAGVVRSPSQQAGSSREALPESRVCRVALPEGREWS